MTPEGLQCIRGSQGWLGGALLDRLLRLDTATIWWWRGMRTRVEVHARDRSLSQCFVRNFIAVGETLSMEDFGDNPLEAMTREQGRDWLAYLHARAPALRSRLPAGGGRSWCRHISILQTAVGLTLAAELPDDNPATGPKVIHARHH